MMRLEVRFPSSGSTHVWNICCLHLFLRRWLLSGLYPSVALHSSEERRLDPGVGDRAGLLSIKLRAYRRRRQAGLLRGKHQNLRKTDGEPGEICTGEGRRPRGDSRVSHPQQVWAASSGGWCVRYLLTRSGPLVSASRRDGASLGQHGKWNSFPPA